MVDMSVEIDVNKTNESHRWIICNYYYFLEVNFRFQTKLCDGCHKSMQKVKSFDDFAIFSAKRNDYRILFWSISKDEAMILLNNTNLKENIALFSKHKKPIFFYLCIED